MLERYSLGTGDRFGQQGKAQLKAIDRAKKEAGLIITPVWNKSHREHIIIGTGPKDVRIEADEATTELGWEGTYCVDADHITKEMVDDYIPHSDFFTIDVAEYIGKKCDKAEKKAFIKGNTDSIGIISIPGIEEDFSITEKFLERWADQYLLALLKARDIYEYISQNKTTHPVFEISMDEVDTPQTPIELYFILKTAAEKEITVNTIAPKFTGDFYKGVDYSGNIDRFLKEFEQDILVIAHCIEKFDLPSDLKLSIHSGSDKFSLYLPINSLLKKHNAGVHLKTSGTTWLEEVIGLADSGPEGLKMVKDIYKKAYDSYDELTQPYKPVINLEKDYLPESETFYKWSSEKIISKLEHNPNRATFDSQLRQFFHCSYKIAAEQRKKFINLLQQYEKSIGDRVTNNLYTRHIRPLFLGK